MRLIHGKSLFVAILLLLPVPSLGMVLDANTVWSGTVSVEEDVFVPPGVTLTIAPGTTVIVTPSESTKTDPEYLSPLTEIIVRGTLKADGAGASPVTFASTGGTPSSWAGIIVDSGTVELNTVKVYNAETALSVIAGTATVTDSMFSKNRYGLTAHGDKTVVRVTSTRITENDYGVVLLGGAKMENTDTTIAGNLKRDEYAAEPKAYRPALREFSASRSEASRVYGDDALLGTTIWQNRIRINGIIRVPEGSRLIVLPGTVIEFSKKDTNADGIGENGLLIQGMIIAKGTKDQPIIFRSAESARQAGDWDSINIMNSDRAQNLIEYCQIEDAYRGLHFHFANVAVNESVIRNNYRGIQFQESIVSISSSSFYGNKSGMQARDSEIWFSGNTIVRNYTGMNVFRTTIALRDNVIMNNEQDGLRVREGIPLIEGNLINGNRYGILVSNGLYGTYSRNVISGNLENGVSLRDTDNIEITENIVQANGLNGFSIQNSGALIRGNLISDNGERGIGVLSFSGVITENNILRNTLYNLGIDGSGDVSAGGNWWGGEDLAKTVYDNADDPEKGHANVLPVSGEPFPVSWPLPSVQSDAAWHGRMLINGNVAVTHGTILTVTPGTRVMFAQGAGLSVEGRILARGTRDGRIVFTAGAGKDKGVWDEIHLDHATGSVFENCIFENAAWALHSHFTDLLVDGCSFVNNQGGMRFTSGPIEVKNSFFSGNEIGIRDFRGTALVSGNIITGNETGIFVREKGSGLTVRGNNIYDNSGYNIRIGDFNDEDVDARENWWGSDNPAVTVYDDRQEPGIGRVILEPFANQPFALKIAAALCADEQARLKEGNAGEEKP